MKKKPSCLRKSIPIAACLVGLYILVQLVTQPDGILEAASGPAGAQREEFYIYVDLNEDKLYVYQNGQLFKTFPCSGGKYTTPSPLGTWKIVSKDTWNEGFGGTWMALNVPWGQYGIHGTDEPWTVGSNASKGCIRMFNEDAEELRKLVPYGTHVTIVKGTYGYFGDSFRTLKNGHIGSDVYAVQIRLGQLGYYMGTPDGKFGAGLSDSVKRFKQDHQLGSTPVVDEATYEAMGFFPFE